MIIRLLVLILVAIGLFLMLRRFFRPGDGTVTCSKCEGKGFWYGARGKEKCDWCKGSGRVPVDPG